MGDEIAREISVSLRMKESATLDPFIREAQAAQREVAKLKREMEQLSQASRFEANHRSTDPLTAQATSRRSSFEAQISADIAAAAVEAKARQERLKAFDWGAANGLVVHSGMAGRDATLAGRMQAALGAEKQFASPEALAELDALKKRAEAAKTGVAELDKVTKSVTGSQAFADGLKKSIAPMNAVKSGLVALRENFGFFLGVGFAVVEGVEAIAKAFDSAGRATKRYVDTVGTLEDQRKGLAALGADSAAFRKALGMSPAEDKQTETARDKLREIFGESRAEVAKRTGVELPDNPYAAGMFGDAFAEYLERTLGGKEGVFGSTGKRQQFTLERAVHAQRIKDLLRQEASLTEDSPYQRELLREIRGNLMTARAGLGGSESAIRSIDALVAPAQAELLFGPTVRAFGVELMRAPDMVKSAARGFSDALLFAGGAARAVAGDFKFGFLADKTLKSLGLDQADIAGTLAAKGGERQLAIQALSELRAKSQFTGNATDRAEFQSALKRYDSVLTYGDRMGFTIDARGAKVTVNQRVETDNPAMLARASLRAGFEAVARYPIEAKSRPGSVRLANGRRR